MSTAPDSAARPTHAPCTIIQANSADPVLALRELWHYRELLAFLAWRDLRVRYRQTLLGGAWALLEPTLSVVLFTLLFNRLAGIETGGVPYPLYCYAGVALWAFFGRSLRATSASLVTNAALVTKVYFPRLVLPLAAQLTAVVDFACSLVVYGALMAWYGRAPGLAIATLPVWVLLGALNALGVGLTLAAINVRYRDVTQAVPFLVQVWLFATPVAYPLSAVPARWLEVYQLNPMVAVVEGLRWALVPGCPLDLGLLLPSGVVGLALLAVGLLWFRQVQQSLADVV